MVTETHDRDKGAEDFMKSIIALLLCALLAVSTALAEPPFDDVPGSVFEIIPGDAPETPGDPGASESGEVFAIQVDGETVELAFDRSPLYSSAQGGMVQASYYAYGKDGVTLYELYVNFPESARPGMVITPEYEAMTNGNSSVSLVVSTDSQNQVYYFSSLSGGSVYPEGSDFSIALDDIAEGSGGATYSGRLSATLVALDLISGKAERTLVIPETPFRFTLGGKAAPGPVPASTPTPSDMRKV